MHFARRQFLHIAAAGSGALLVSPWMAFAAAATERRFVFIIQRGAADGLSMVMPTGDPDHARARGAMIEKIGAPLALNSEFGLHPALAETARMYAAGQALFVHAVATGYRERSHFDAQNLLETGGAQPNALRDGWLNRLTGMLPQHEQDAIAFAPTLPVALRGAVQVASYAPSALPQPTDDLLARVGQMYASDTQLNGLWGEAMRARGIAGERGPRQDPASLGKLAASFLVRPDGPRIAMLETGGWDTQVEQVSRLGFQLKGLDTLVAALRDGLGPVWNDTVVLVATEFGRTIAINGTGGTDHGTATSAMLLGGAVKGGRVIADWPGLGASALYEGRDLRPTARMEEMITGVVAECFGLDPARVARTLYPQTASLKPGTSYLR